MGRTRQRWPPRCSPGDNSTGGHGASGAGGMGGFVTNGPPTPWSNVGYCIWEAGNSGYSSSNSQCPTSQTNPPEWGEGGEGHWGGATQPIGGGGSGGGGWGGGDGGGAGGNSDPGGGGAGAGSFALKATASVPSDFQTPADGQLCSGCNNGATGDVVVSFVTG